uniref:MTD1 family protein n=1 Tax=Rhizophora mucronata TaxID=61149 RepID=A0A2P2M7I9_RHIMU
MSIELESSGSSSGGGEIEPSGFARAALSNFESQQAEGNECSTASSSIGKNSDLSDGASSGGEDNEVQSAFAGAIDALQEALPIRRGISKFYNGKSKSFTSLAEASSSPSIKEIAKPENAYTRRRRNLLSFNHIWEKNRSFPHLSNAGGIAKRTVSTSRSTLALAVAMSSSESICSTSEDSNSRSPPDLPPLHPHSRASYNNLASSQWSSPRQKFSPCWSFSFADLQQCNIGTTINSSCYLECNKDDQ